MGASSDMNNKQKDLHKMAKIYNNKTDTKTALNIQKYLHCRLHVYDFGLLIIVLYVANYKSSSSK